MCYARACLGDKKEEECIIPIDAYRDVSEQGNWSSHIWHVIGGLICMLTNA